jgi:hypothetical protein
MPSCDLCNFLLTHRAESVLLFPEMEQPLFPFQGVRYVNVKTFFIVALPCWIIRIGRGAIIYATSCRTLRPGTAFMC